ncbi:MAG: hypothetical protein LPK03_02660, partial [Pontibacter sp.]|nr:hypothetical protein [Pontibacter sp.]
QTLSPLELRALIERTLSANSVVHIGWASYTFTLPFNLDPNLFGLSASLLLYVTLTYLYPDKTKKNKHGREQQRELPRVYTEQPSGA